MKFLDIDSPLITFLSRMADLMWLTILTMICSIPFFTIGASLTAMHYVALKMVRNEECYITRSYFKAFKTNFKQATVIWLIFAAIFVFLFVDYRIFRTSGMKANILIQFLFCTVLSFTVFTFTYVWPVLAKFDNTIRRTITNAFIISVNQFFKTLIMIALYITPFLLWYFAELTIRPIMPIMFVFWLSVPAYLSAKMYDKFFQAMEDQILAEQVQDTDDTEEDERIFKDEADPALNIGQHDQ